MGIKDEGLLFLASMIDRGDSLSDIHAKALANYMLREIIEDVQVKYGISAEDMTEINKKAANRAKLYVEEVEPDPDIRLAFCGEAIMCDGWDAPEITEEEERKLEFYKAGAREITEIKKMLRKSGKRKTGK